MVLNILAVGTLPPHPGGSSISSWQLLRALERSGHRVRSLSPRTPATAAECECIDAEMAGTSVRYEVAEFATDMSASLVEVLNVEKRRIPIHLERLIAREWPDVILVGRDTTAPAVAEFAARHRIPWVLRSTGYILRTIEEGRHPKEVVDALLDAAKAADTTVLQAAHLQPLAHSLGYRRMLVIPNAVDETLFTPRPRCVDLCADLRIGPDTPVVVHASNLKPVKRVIDMVDSAARVLAKRPDVVYVIAGNGPCRMDLERRCAELGITERFRFPGWLPYEAMPKLFSIADLVVMPSAFELQAGVYLETQASGRTLLASDVAGAREVVDDGRTGLLFRTGDTEDLADKTLLALSDANLRGAVGARAAVEVLKRHSLHTVAGQFAQVLETAARADSEEVA